MKSFFRNEEFLQKLRSCELVKNARKINFSQRKISSHPKTTVTEENDFVFLKGFGNGGENVQKSSAAKFRDLMVKNLEKMKFAKEKIWEICRMIEDFFLVAGHLGEGLVEFVRDGLEFLLFVDQLIFKSVDFLL